MEQAKISVLIPVYNTKRTLARCLDSVLGQTLKDIEIICVDDGSDGETKAALRAYAERDGRIRVLTHAENRGLLYARKTAVEAASARFCMILDSDDEFVPNACERAYREIVKRKADVVQFGTEIVCEEGVPESAAAPMRRCVRVKKGALRGEKIFSVLMGAGDSRWNLWNKIYETELLRRAAAYIPEKKCVMAEDFMISFIVLAEAERFFGIKDKLIRYSFGNGVSTASVRGKSGYIWFARRETACKAAEAYLSDRKRSGQYSEALQNRRKEFFRSTLCAWLFECPAEYSAEIFDEIVSEYGAEAAAEELVKTFGAWRAGEIAKKMGGARCLQTERKEIKTVAFFYHRYYNGGVERVMSLLIPKFQSWGYRTVLLVEEKNAKDYPLPENCPKIVLPTSIECGGEGYAKHAKALGEALRKYGVDALLYQAASSECLLFDMLVAKGCGVRFYVSMHEAFGLPLMLRGQAFASSPYILRLADGVQTLMRSDAALLCANGINAHYITNPVDFAVAGERSPAGKNIVWVGRFDDRQKRPRDAIRILAEAVKSVPDARLTLVGSSGSRAADALYKKFAKECGVEKNIDFAGFCARPDKYYARASVLLFTSAYEACSMVLLEGMGHALPVVSYQMPYQEPLRQNGGGCICVEQGDVWAAARAVTSLLTDETKRAAMADCSLAAAKKFASADLRGGWEGMFCGRAQCAADENDLRIGMQSLSDFYGRSFFGNGGGGVVAKGLRYWKTHGFFRTVSRTALYVRQNGLKGTVRRIFGK